MHRTLVLVGLVGCTVDIDRRMWAPEIEASRVEVKEYWLPDDNERARIHDHLERVAVELVAAETSQLRPDQARARQAAIERLWEYREARRYPHNHDLASRTPVFVDRHGTRCAMADLIEHAGGGELVARVAAAANHASVAELAEDSELLAWLDRNGLTLDEAARIQPTYEHIYPCLAGVPVDGDDTTPGLQPDAQVSVFQFPTPSRPIEQTLPPCGRGGACYRLAVDPACSIGAGYAIEIEPAGFGPRAWLHAEILVE